jgi:hypothetical protein
VKIDSVFTQRDLIAMFQFAVFHPGFVDKSPVGAVQILDEIPAGSFDEFCVMPRNMLIIQNDVSVAFPANEHFRRHERQDILLTVRT